MADGGDGAGGRNARHAERGAARRGILDISTMDDAVLRPAEATAGGAPTDEPGFPATSDFSTETVEGDLDAAADLSAEVSPEPEVARWRRIGHEIGAGIQTLFSA